MVSFPEFWPAASRLPRIGSHLTLTDTSSWFAAEPRPRADPGCELPASAVPITLFWGSPGLNWSRPAAGHSPTTVAAAQASTGPSQRANAKKKTSRHKPPAQAAVDSRHHHRLEQPSPAQPSPAKRPSVHPSPQLLASTTPTAHHRHISSTASSVSASSSAPPAVLPSPSLAFSAVAAASSADSRPHSRLHRALPPRQSDSSHLATPLSQLPHLADLHRPANPSSLPSSRNLGAVRAPCRLPHRRLRRI